MAARNHGELAQALPRLRHDFEASRHLVTRAMDRAARLSENAAAIRRLLATRARHPRPRLTPAAEVWHAAAHEMLRVAHERDRELGIVAHELRQPLAAALAAERLLAVDDRPNETARARAVLTRQLLQLSELVDSLLDYSRLTTQPPRVRETPVDMIEIVCGAIESVEAVAAERRLRIHGPRGGERALVLGDRSRLRQALLNLLQNAVRYTPPGGRIDVSVRAGDANVVAEVRDTGQGIATEHLDAIFDPFVRLSAAGPGLGVGLALVRRIVEMHGGAVQAASAGEGYGSAFTIVLPRAGAQGGGDGA